VATARVFVRLRRKERERIARTGARARDARHRDRCRAVLWSDEGRSLGEIANLLGVDPRTVGRWIQDYRRFGVKGLQVGKSPGRPRLIDDDGDEALREALRHNPRDLGYGFSRWTLETLVQHLYTVVHVQVSADTVRKALKRMDYRYGRPKLSLKHRQNRREVRRAKRARAEALKKGRRTPTATPSCTWTSASSISIPA
jgi:transposase